MYYSNQKMVAINREIPKKTSNKPYLCCYTENIEKAMKDLSKSAFQCYVYLLCNRNGYELEYSPKHISMKTNICLESARKSFLEMEKKGYLIASAENKHFYNFYETPQKREIKKTIINPYTGEVLEGLTYTETMKLFGYVEGIQLWMEGE